MKQTAVDFLYKFLYEMESFEGFDPYNFNQEEVFAKAKAMEKEQIVKTFTNVTVATLQNLNIKSTIQDILDFKKIAEVYYNETFKSE